MKPGHRIETVLGAALLAGFRTQSWPRSLRTGAALGSLVRRIGIRRAVAEDNLARAFPDRSEAGRRDILVEHYRELGRVAAEYGRLPELVRRREDVFASTVGIEHLEHARGQGRGAILMTGHFGNFELFGASLGGWNPVDFVVRPLSNPGMEAVVARLRHEAGVSSISADDGLRGVFRSLRANRWVAMLADQDARRHGVFVPFLGRPASTPIGPARIALQTGAPIIMAFTVRQPDGRYAMVIEPPLTLTDPDGPDAARRLTALHTARLEAWVRRHPAMWFWLHRRWKTAPLPASGS
jgi:Kdo2-lipid IVA lauroyltransferase/acyltransferase